MVDRSRQIRNTARPKLPPGDNSWAVRVNRWTLITSRYYLRIMLTAIAVFIALPFAAPALMKIGLRGPGEALYAIYSPMCHQFAFRSWFLFGEQVVYPRAAANLPGVQPYELYLPDIMANLGEQQDRSALAFENNSRFFLGNERMGYKVAICQRDVGLYLALLAGGLIYSIPYVRKRLRPLPILLYLLVGLGPIGLDGVSQLLSAPQLALWPLRETTPLFRTLTGALFGLMTAWLAFPYLEQSAREVIQEIEAKFERRRLRERLSEAQD